MKAFVGQVLGDYRIVEEIGAGGMGKVFLTENVHHKKRCALKMLPAELSRDASFRDRFFDEARVMSDLNHPGIVRVHHTGEDKSVYYLVMDYVCAVGGRSRSIQDELAQSPAHRLAERQVHHWITQVAQALAYAHQRGVIHRDIKPANVLIDADGNARITDFGLAKAVGKEFLLSQIHQSIQQTSRDLTAGGVGLNLPGVLPDFELSQTARPDMAAGSAGRRSGSGDSAAGSSSHGLFGTYDYMSPELMEGKDATVQSDIYSLGVMIYRMLTGRRPVGLAKPPSTVVRGLSKKWDAITARCLADSGADRYPSVQSLLADLANVGRRPGRRIVVTTGIVLLVGVLSLAAWTYLRPRMLQPSAPTAEASGPSPKQEMPKSVPTPVPDQPPASSGTVGQPPVKDDQETQAPVPAVDPGKVYVEKIGQALQNCFMLDELIPEPNGAAPTTIRKLRDAWEDVASGVSGEGARIMTRVKTLEDIATTSDPNALITLVAAGPPGLQSEALAAWYRLGKLPKPLGQDQWKKCEGLQSDLLKRLGDAGLSSAARVSEVQQQIKQAGQDCEKAFRLALIERQLKTLREKSENDEFLKRVLDLKFADMNDLTFLRDWGAALGDFVRQGPWPAASEREKFYREDPNANRFLTKLLAPTDLGDWLKALQRRPKDSPPPAPIPPSHSPPVVLPDKLTVKFGTSEFELKLRRIPAEGLRFRMGIPTVKMVSTEDPQQRDSGQFPSDFYIGMYEITQQQYRAVMDGNPSLFQDDRRPVERVSWKQASDFCTELSRRSDRRFLGSDSDAKEYAVQSPRFRLPSEQEWEYACRGQRGKETRTEELSTYQYRDFYSGDSDRSLNSVGWYDRNSSRETRPAGDSGVKPNLWGLHDMHGNVWEWCADAYEPGLGGRRDSKGRVIRGGAYDSTWEECRSGWRDGCAEDTRRENIGFRVVLDVK